MTLINHPASDETLGRVASALETANTLTAAQLAGTSGAAIYDAFYAAGVTPENIDDMFVAPTTASTPKRSFWPAGSTC